METTQTRLLTLHISGAVAHPGLVQVVAPARVADVIVAAGGALPDAVLGAVNLAASVSDGQHILVPGSDGGSGSGSVTAASGKVAVNQADVAQLETLPGVGPVLAKRIYDYRKDNGPFATVEDLLDVPGIGESKLAALRDEVTVP
jgi:competence protein ComEA